MGLGLRRPNSISGSAPMVMYSQAHKYPLSTCSVKMQLLYETNAGSLLWSLLWSLL